VSDAARAAGGDAPSQVAAGPQAPRSADLDEMSMTVMHNSSRPDDTGARSASGLGCRPMSAFTDVAEVRADPARTRVYEHGWQSWSPSGLHPATGRSPRPARPNWQWMAYRPETPGPPEGFQGEGLLAVVAEDGTARLWVAPEPTRAVPSIRARAQADRVVVSADGPVVEREAPDGLLAGLEAWADEAARAAGVPELRSLGPGWCSWYTYWNEVSEADVVRNLEAIDRLGLDVAVVQVDDGHQADIGDWTVRSPRFGPLDALAARIRDTGREPGIWTAPFLVGERSALAREHPDWLVGGIEAATEGLWQGRSRVLDVTHPEAAEHLAGVFRTLVAEGFTYHKIDFLYAGAMHGRRHEDAEPIAAYRRGVELVREALGSGATLLLCGAPLLPSLGLADAMRISPDVDPAWEPPDGDVSQPGMCSAVTMGRARAWQHGRFWINDPDCLVLRPEVAERERWAEHVRRVGGLAVSSDPLDGLDERGLELTRELLRPATPAPLELHGEEGLLHAD
jgi:alpha-galactosidase